jgi:hypothetical protein
MAAVKTSLTMLTETVKASINMITASVEVICTSGMTERCLLSGTTI